MDLPRIIWFRMKTRCLLRKTANSGSCLYVTYKMPSEGGASRRHGCGDSFTSEREPRSTEFLLCMEYVPCTVIHSDIFYFLFFFLWERSDSAKKEKREKKGIGWLSSGASLARIPATRKLQDDGWRA